MPNVNKRTLQKVLTYCEFHKNDNNLPEIQKPLKSSNLGEIDDISDWDVGYINIEKIEEIFELILAANYLHIPSLMELSCAKIASLIKGKLSIIQLITLLGKSADDIRKTFNIVNDFTKEEEQQIKDENRWAEESV